jgi:redox-sensitive bicupin YhaK (pirin superfamily)
MMILRRADARGRSRFDWLDSRHSFSFGDYFDPQHMGFGPLRVINEDRVTPGAGFGAHGHRDMEIVSWVLEGAMEHRDSLGTGSVIRPGEVQRMTAGTGIRHSEFNHSPTDPLHFLQIWILPEREGLEPGYEQRAFADEDLRGGLKLVAGRGGRDGAITVHQDADLYVGRLAAGVEITHALEPGRLGWVQVARGVLTVNGERLEAGDGAGFRGEPAIRLGDAGNAEVLLFDMTG